MAGAGFILSSQTFLFSIPKLPSKLRNHLPFISRKIHCSCTQVNAVDLAKYREVFSRRMNMAGLKPHHRIAIGVLGGPDSMALCALTTLWKCHDGFDGDGFVDGVLAVIVDHQLRQESAEEAGVVSDRVAKMGIRSEVVCCDWSGGKPKQGHVQENARDMRYRIFQSVCVKNRIGMLLTAHHADDQAELFVIRLSRNSGIVVSACRATRVYIDYVCRNLMSKAVTVSQFVSQRHRPLRDNTSRLLVDYMRSLPCKTSLTAAGCFLSPAPGSKGMRALVCSSVDCPLPSNVGLSHQHFHVEQEHSMPDEIEQIIADGKSYADRLVSNVSDVPFLEVTCNSVLTEARRLGMISESTHTEILSLQKEEVEHFKSKSEVKVDRKSKHETKSEASDEEIQRGCKSCVIDHNTVLEVRNMSEQDWLYLSNLSNSHISVNLQEQSNSSDMKVEQRKAETDTCLDYARVSAQRALRSLKSVPAAARRGLPVLVNSQGLLLSVAGIDFQACPCLMVSATFKPKVPLGGDHSSFV